MAQMISQPGARKVSPLTGLELVSINAGAVSAFCSTQDIANLSGAAGQTINTAITTAGNGTLTAAAIEGGIITRTGPVAAFTDTTDTAANIVAAIPNAFIGQSFYLRIKNATAFAETLAGGTGVTFSGSLVIPANSIGTYLLTLTSLTAVTLLHIVTSTLTDNAPEVVTALTTAGNGTITGAGIAGGVTARSGPTAIFTDTTDTAANIIAAEPNAHIGLSWEWTYQNNVAFTATLAGGTNVTVSGITAVPGNTRARFLVTYTAANTVTIVGIAESLAAAIPPSQFTTGALSAGALAAGAITGAAIVYLQNTGATPGNQQVRTAAQMLADFPGAYAGLSYTLRIINTGAGTLTLIADGGATVTLTGTATVAQNVTRDYIVTFNTATTATIQSVGSGVSP